MVPQIPFFKPFRFILGLLLFFSFGFPEIAKATHIRAGEILVLPDSSTTDPRCVIFKLITYTDFANTNADNPEATMFFGDGEKLENVPRWRRTTARAQDTYRSVYYFPHCFPAPGTYTVTYTEQNRATGVININDSQNQSFLLQTTLTIDPFMGANRSPVLLISPLDYGACGQPFVHNPGAYDADGDSLAYRFVTPKRNLPTGSIDLPEIGDVTGYRPLNDPSFGCQAFPNPPGGASTLTIDRFTGQITWNAPCQEGDYNVAFVVEEYRGGRKIGEVMRDMQVRVECIPQLRPTLQVPRDTCVVAGTTVTGLVRATDPENTTLTLEAFSAVLPPATFTQNGNNGTFVWPTTCADVLRDTVQVTFRVTKSIPNPPSPAPIVLSDIQPWRIRIVAPAPQNFKVVPDGKSMDLTWDPYMCQNATKLVVYRHEGPSDFVPGPCETGIPEGAGFVRIGEVGTNDTTFTDNGSAGGLKRGVTYCYVVYAEFPGPNFRTLSSIATVPVCIMLENNVPVLTNVSVERTNETDGQILVKWTQPTEGLQNLTTPFQYRLSRAPGAAQQNFTEVFRTNNISETSYLDSPVSTSATAGPIKWIYKLEFYHRAGLPNEELVDTASIASSVQLKAVSGATSIQLDWTYDVPWDNSQRKHLVYRKINDQFVLIDSVDATRTAGRYVDRGTFGNEALQPNQVYCYYVQTNGTYGSDKLPDPLLNKSQEFCIALLDSVAPCPPVLSIDQLNCDTFLDNPSSPPYQNVLTWVPDVSDNCDQGISYYTIYFRPEAEAEPDSIGFTTAGITTFTHMNLNSFAGCYVVTATDSAGNESVASNQVCKDNCFFFRLPNIFTPNNDEKNDTFRPDPRSRFIKSIKFTVFNRWGEKVFEGDQDPNINWRGVNNAGKEVAEGTYYYLAEVEFLTSTPANARRNYKGWVEIVR
jgi:gliding motility-associated-like protein